MTIAQLQAIRHDYGQQLWKIATHRAVIKHSRLQCVRRMETLLAQAEYGPLSIESGREYDLLAARAQDITSYLPTLDAAVAVLEGRIRQVEAELSQAVEKQCEAQEVRRLRRQEREAEAKARRQPEPVAPQIRTSDAPSRRSERWRDWEGTIAGRVEPVLEVREVPAIEEVDPRLLSDEVDRRARLEMLGAPWNKRQRNSRRYEGFQTSWRRRQG